MTANVRPLRSRPVLAGSLVALFICAFIAAAYWDWMWWEPYSALLPYLVEGALFLVTVVLALTRRTRPLAIASAMVALGLVAGQVLGPSRPELRNGEGTVVVRLIAPVTAEGSAGATCATSDGAGEFQLSGDPNMRIDIFPDNPAAPPDIDQREFVSVYLTIGERWRRSVRPDETAFHISVGRVEADLPESWMMAGPSSRLTVDWTAETGRVEFADLVLESRPNEQPGEFIDVAGTLEWTCIYGP